MFLYPGAGQQGAPLLVMNTSLWDKELPARLIWAQWAEVAALRSECSIWRWCHQSEEGGGSIEGGATHWVYECAVCSVSLSDPRHRHIELQKDGNTKQLSCPSLIYSLSCKAEGQHVQTGGRSSSPKPEQQSDLLQWQRTESCDTYSLLRAKLPISHQVNLIGEVHTHGQLDEQVDAETIATLRDDGLTWTHKHSLISVIQLYIYGAQTHAQKTGQIGSGRMAC